MARPVKRGLSYFPRSVNYFFDYKIMDLLSKYGPLGMTIFDIILTMVYAEGYYLAVPLDHLAAQIVRLIGNRWVNNKELVLQVIRYCGKIGLFHDDLLRQGVITSAEIQENYAEVTVRSKADKSKYWLLGDPGQPGDRIPESKINPVKTTVSAAKTPVDAAPIPQKQIKENKREAELGLANALNGNFESSFHASPAGKTAPETDAPGLSLAVLEEFSRIKVPTSGERIRLGQLCRRHGNYRVLTAIQDTLRKGGRSLKYLEIILEDIAQRKDRPVESITAPVMSRNGMYVSAPSPVDIEELLNEEWLSEDY